MHVKCLVQASRHRCVHYLALCPYIDTDAIKALLRASHHPSIQPTRKRSVDASLPTESKHTTGGPPTRQSEVHSPGTHV